MIPRFVENHVYEMLAQLHKAILILSARQVGKTTLLQSLQKRLDRLLDRAEVVIIRGPSFRAQGRKNIFEEVKIDAQTL